MLFVQVLTSIFGVFLVLWLVRHLRKLSRLLALSRKLPGPKNYPIIGIADRLMGASGKEMFELLTGIFADYPGISKVWFGPDLFCFVSKPEYLEKILNHPGAVSKSVIYDPAKDFMDPKGLFMADFGRWRKTRRILEPAFNKRNLNSFVSCFNEQSAVLVEMMKKDWECGEFEEVPKYVSNYYTDVVSETLFDCKVSAQKRRSSLGKIYDKLFEIVLEEGSKPWYRLKMILKWSKLYKEKMELINEIDEIVSEVFESKKSEIYVDDEHLLDENTTKFKSVIELLFTRKLREPQYTDQRIKGEINAMLVASVDTTTISTCFALLLLGMHPEIQAKVHSEMNEITKGRDDKTIKAEDLQRLKYTERVIKESARLFPSAPFISRKFDSDLILDDIVIPEGANALLGFFNVQRDAKYWPDPLKFDPDRFLPEETSKRHPYTWNAFSGGPRNCIGYRFAMMMMKFVMAAFVMNFEISTSYGSVEDIDLKMDVFTKPVDGYKIIMKPRK